MCWKIPYLIAKNAHLSQTHVVVLFLHETSHQHPFFPLNLCFQVNCHANLEICEFPDLQLNLIQAK